MAPALIVVGASLGGFSALQTLLSALPPTFAPALAIVQHRGVEIDESPSLLQASCPLPVAEVEDKDVIAGGRVYLAPADYHLLVDADHFALSTGPRVSLARPSIDVLFESAADSRGRDLVALILTGASSDGARGAARVKERAGILLVEDPATAECPVMPAAAIAAAPVDHVLPLHQIAPLLIRLFST